MSHLLKVLAILALVILIPQTIRHAYFLWVEPRNSVLDKYERPLKDEILRAASLGELLRRYESVHKQAEQVRARLRQEKPDSAVFPQDVEPFKSEFALREAITSWEERDKELLGLRFYWSVGFLCLVIGAVLFKCGNRWFGLTLQIAAFSEIIYWTSPTFFGATIREFDRLLINKLIFTVVSLALLVGLIIYERIFWERRPGDAA